MAEMYEYLYNELTVDERNQFWDDFYDEVQDYYPELMNEEF